MTQKRQRRSSLSFEKLEPRSMLATFVVTGFLDVVDANDSELSLREAILLANSNGEDDVIELPEGVQFMSIEGIEEDESQTGDFDILPDGGSSLTIRGLSPATTAIDGFENDRIFEVHPESNLLLEGIQVRNGSVADYPSIDQQRGGLVASFHATFNAQNVNFLAGDAGPRGSGGAVFIVGGSYDINDVEFLSNNAFFAGSALFARDSVGRIELAKVNDNTTELNTPDDFRDGGAVTIRSGELNIRRSDFQRNVGGGMHAFWTTISADHTRFRLTEGYAFSAHNVIVDINGSWFGQNSNTIKVTNQNAILNLTEVRLRSNRSHAVEFFGKTLTVDDSEFRSNRGSGIVGEKATETGTDDSITVRGTTFFANHSAIDVTTGKFHLESSTVDFNGGNFIDPDRQYFGVSVKAFDAAIINSSIVRNKSRSGTASIQFDPAVDDAPLRIVNSLVADNTGFDFRDGKNGGGAIYVGNSEETETGTAKISIHSSTFQDNQGATLGGVVSAVGTEADVTIKNSIIWFHTANDGSPYAGVSSFDVTDSLLYPLEEGTVQFGGAANNNSAEDPMWVDWQQLDFRLLPDSPAIDHGSLDHLIPDEFDLDGDGNTTEPNPDLDLNNRVSGLGTDAGAFEFPTIVI